MTSVDISCAFATSPSTPDHVVAAEELGYRRAWLYDSPALYPDVWVELARAADRTTRIGLGPAVLIPSLRHPIVNAAAIATVADLAPGRLAVAIGSGFTGRYTLGKKPLPWAQVAEYVRVVRALLRGESALWEGSVISMMHPGGFAPARPIDVPILIASGGPKGRAVAVELGDGVFQAGVAPTDPDLPDWRALLVFGTVLADGEDLASERVLAAAGHAFAVAYHGSYERGGAAAVDRLPGGATWRASIEEIPTDRRHLAIHEDHLVGVTDRDRPAVLQGVSMLGQVTLTGTPDELRRRVDSLAEAGITEIAYQPAGPDIPGELERFVRALT